MATFLTQTQVDNIHQLYVSYFGRAADASGADYWGDVYLAGLNAGKSDALIIAEMAGAFAQSVEFATNYPATLSAAAFVDKIYMNVLGRVADADGKAYWVAQLESGAVAKSDFIVAIVNAVEAQGPTSSDYQYLENRVQVSEYFSENIVESTTQEQIDILAGVTADDATVAAAIAEIDGAANVGETYTLTTGQDAIPGTVGNDTILGLVDGTANTFTLGDSINGGEGADTLKVTVDQDALNVGIATISNVENFVADIRGDGFDTLNLASKAFTSGNPPIFSCGQK